MMPRSRLICFALALGATLDPGVSQGAERRDGTLGSACDGDGDCDASSGLRCLGLLDPVIPGGTCSLSCMSDKDCRDYDANTFCAANICVESCTINSWYGEDFSPKKCHGRTDTSCWRVACSGCKDDFGVCLSRCTTDADCEGGLFCDVGSGRCQEEPPTGKPHGSSCDIYEERNDLFFRNRECLGLCFTDFQRQDVNRVEGICIEPCVIGAPNACDPEHTRRACIAPVESQGRTAGDYGACVALCDCSSDCPEGQSCDPWDFGGKFDAAGVCRRAPKLPGAPDCISDEQAGEAMPRCEYGSVRACKTETCLGVAECLENGEYGPCRCVATESNGDAGAGGGTSGPTPVSGDAGATPDGEKAPRVARSRSGCACRAAPPSKGSETFFGACLLVAAVVFRRRRRQSL